MRSGPLRRRGSADDGRRREAVPGPGTHVTTWSNGTDTVYAWHEHIYHKRLYCTAGRITFHTNEGDFELRPGDRLDLDPDTSHGATVGSEGVTCVEAEL